jgi:Tol biopolymer transport system component
MLHREPEPISHLNQDVPPEFQDIVRKAMAKRPFQRYQNASEMLQDIRALSRRMQSEMSHTWSGVSRPKPRMRTGVLAVAGVAVVIAAVAGGLIWRAWTAGPPELAGRHRKLTTSPDWDGQPAISPDETMVAYASNASGSEDIWLVLITGDEPAQRTKHPGSDTDPAWMPDGGSLVFVSDRTGSPAVWRMPALGGSPVRMLNNAQYPAISPDGRWIAFSTPGIGGLLRIAVAPLDNLADIRVITGEDDGVWDHRSPAWSPDSRTLCYADQRDLWLVPVDGGPATQLTVDSAADFEPVWSVDGRFIIFASVRDRMYCTSRFWRGLTIRR